jgi:uncharacterized membrane protein
MWTREILGTDIYHLLAAFMLYSIFGWCLESIYMSFCNKKLTNRGFAKGPYCPIYGFGAVAGYIMLSPFKGHYIKLYLTGAFLATLFEFVVGKGMIRFLGELWWDYNEKPFNYQGIICLESTIAWGFYAIGIIQFVNDGIYKIIDYVSLNIGLWVLRIVFAVVVVDYIMQLKKVLNIDIKEKGTKIREHCHELLARL